MYYHRRQVRKTYERRNKADRLRTDQCTYCYNITPEQRVSETEHCILFRNRVPYSNWEFHDVESHLLIVPKRHVLALSDLTDEEMLDYMKLCAQFEKQGYSIYARGVGSKRRTVDHQHTHLIKIGPKVSKAGFYNSKPYLHVRLG